jgi:hypothetical protein
MLNRDNHLDILLIDHQMIAHQRVNAHKQTAENTRVFTQENRKMISGLERM